MQYKYNSYTVVNIKNYTNGAEQQLATRVDSMLTTLCLEKTRNVIVVEVEFHEPCNCRFTPEQHTVSFMTTCLPAFARPLQICAHNSNSNADGNAS